MQFPLFTTQAERIIAKPFLKWAGGKSQLLEQYKNYYPIKLLEGRIDTYVEPFIGGGAVLFDIVSKYKLRKIVIADINPELILAYRTIKNKAQDLIDKLQNMQERYYYLPENKREDFYYDIRNLFNLKRAEINYKHFQISWIERTAEIIFLNRTCFNGLFRVNRQGDFNVPFGRYKNPMICDKENLSKISVILKNVTIILGDFKKVERHISKNTFVYFDPPYRPISKTSSFTSYSKDTFGDIEQIRLSKFFRELDKIGASLMLSNSDPKNFNQKDNFFENAYAGFFINRLSAIRMINSKADKRGPITELLITNYDNYART